MTALYVATARPASPAYRYMGPRSVRAPGSSGALREAPGGPEAGWVGAGGGPPGARPGAGRRISVKMARPALRKTPRTAMPVAVSRQWLARAGTPPSDSPHSAQNFAPARAT